MPLRVAELLASLVTPAYVTRVSVHTPAHIVEAKKALKRAFRYQVENRCYTFVEFLSICPTNWGMTPRESLDWLESTMLPYFPLGDKKIPEDGEDG